MKITTVFCLAAILLAGAAEVSSADMRTYSKSIESVWDEAVKATRDADLVLIDSKRSEHWFTMETPPKTLKKRMQFEVELSRVGDQIMVTVRSVEDEGTKRAAKTIARYLDSLDDRLD